MSPFVLLVGVPLLAGAGWSRAILDDEELYVRAITPLSTSRGFARLAALWVSHRLAGRPSGGGTSIRLRGGHLGARVAARSTTWAMGTPVFGPTWVHGHLLLHRHRRRLRHRGHLLHARTSALMIVLAAMGNATRVLGDGG